MPKKTSETDIDFFYRALSLVSYDIGIERLLQLQEEAQIIAKKFA